MKRRSTEKLTDFLNELESCFPHKEAINDSVSSVNSGWHIEHSILVLNAVVDTMKTSEPTEFKKKFNFTKSYIFAVGRIPRGKARAPKSVRPKETPNHEQLERLVSDARSNLILLSAIDTGKFFKHPIFGNLRLHDSIRFLELHTEHHLKIIRAIQQAK